MPSRFQSALRRTLTLWLLLAPFTIFALEKPATPVPADFEQLLQQGYRYEQSGDWSRAVQLYENAAKANPSSQLLKERLQHCTVRYGLTRRYHDSSYRKRMLALPRGQAIKLYDEVLRRIEDSYVESVSVSKLFRSGIEEILIALEDPQFLQANLRQDAIEQVGPFRDWLRQWRTVAPRDRPEACRHAMTVANQADEWMGMAITPLLLEFTYGACDALDEYSTCLTPDRLTDLYAVIDGNFVGIGVELKSDDEGLLIVGTLPGSPAAEAGLRGGDHIVAIDNVPTIGLPIESAANRLQGAEGTPVNIWIVSVGDQQSRRLTLKRRSVEVQSVIGSQLISPSEGIGYLHITGFQKSTVSELERAVASLQHRGMRSLIVDLRGNPGGLLTSAVDISDRFLPDGVIVTTRGRAEGQTQSYRSQRSNTWRFPLVLLVDGDSASASEILAGAIQDNQRGTIVGVRSFGKGSVQSIFPLDTVEAGIRLTTAKFYSPRGRAYSNQGVRPDIEVPGETALRTAISAGAPPDPASDRQLAAAVQASRQLLSRRLTN